MSSHLNDILEIMAILRELVDNLLAAQQIGLFFLLYSVLTTITILTLRIVFRTGMVIVYEQETQLINQ